LSTVLLTYSIPAIVGYCTRHLENLKSAAIGLTEKNVCEGLSMSTNPGSTFLSRRRFLGQSQAVLAAVGTTGFLACKPQAFGAVENSASADDYYEKLGVEGIINAAGPATALTGALMPAQVQRAVARARATSRGSQ
jgi:hypothetical protein